MPQNNIKKLHTAYGWVDAALIIIVGIMSTTYEKLKAVIDTAFAD